jgi:hypothetical protein
MIHHGGTEDTEDSTENNKELLFSVVSSVPSVPPW